MEDVILRNENIFNKDTLNIFTDASITTIRKPGHNETIGCPGAYVIGGDKELDLQTQILRNSTNNNSEITAIFMGVLEAQKYRNYFKYINIFSDSKISVFGLREWIFNWINNTNNGVMLSSTGKPVANQDIFLKIIYFIINNNLNINLFHINGHINSNNIAQILEAKKTFITSNHINLDVDEELIKNLEIANDVIDRTTRNILLSQTYEPVDKCNPFINYNSNSIDIKKYSNLIGGNNYYESKKVLQRDIIDIANDEPKNH